MRKKSQNEERDRYARRYAAVLAVEDLIRFRAGTGHSTITVEAEDNPLWDDVLQASLRDGGERRHQVKRQLTPLSAADFAEYVKEAANGSATTHYHFAFPSFVSVDGVGELRILNGLCRRVSQPGSDLAKVLSGLMDAERAWLDALTGWTGRSDADVLELLRRVRVDMLGLEEDLDNRALRLLEPIFGSATEEAWRRVREYVSDKDGVVNIDPAALWPLLPAPTGDEVDAFYWSFIEEVEKNFLVQHWPWLTDHLIRDLMPFEFRDGALAFVIDVAGAAWPGRYAGIDAAMKQLADRSEEYVHHFLSRSIERGEWLKEDKTWKSIFPHPQYDEQVAASRAWERGNQRRLFNTVVALNELFAAVRRELRPTYRLRDGKLGVHDQMGVTNQMQSVIHYPNGYVDLADAGEGVE